MPIHPTAIIDRRAELDSSVEVGPYAIIDAHVRIAAGCRVFQHAYVTGWTTIGEQCEIHPGAIIGHVPQDIKHPGERSFCRIGRNNIIREYVTIHRGTEPESATVVGDDCFLLGGCHIAHNCAVGNNVTMINNVLLAGHVHVQDRVTIGGGAGVHQFVRIGELAMVAGNARVPMDVPPFAMTDLDGRVAGLNRIGMRRAGLSREDLAAVRSAYRVLFSKGARFRDALLKLAEQTDANAPPVQRLIRFVQSESRRGIAGRSRGQRGASPESSPL